MAGQQAPSSAAAVASGEEIIPNSALIPIAVIGLCGNLVVALTLLSHNHLRLATSFYTCALQLAVAESLLNGVILGIGLKRVYGDRSQPVEDHRFDCLLDNGFLLFAMYACSGQLLSTTFDRLVAISFPEYYSRCYSKHQTLTLIISGYLWCVDGIVVALALYKANRYHTMFPVCRGDRTMFLKLQKWTFHTTVG